ncbi:MAG: rhodanese-like domain-containing protein [Acidobacteriota bacterium]
MALPTHILLMYGYLVLFGWVLVEQIGIPLPATPVLMAAGALTAEHQLSFGIALAMGVAACLAADTTWFMVGRRHGHRVLRWMCRLSMEPGVCVRRTQGSFDRVGKPLLLFAKFVPGVALLAPPVAGQNGMALGEFVLLDGLGSTLWVAALLAAGRAFGDALRRDPSLLDWVGRFSGALLVLGILGFFAARIVRRRMQLRKMVESRLEPGELLRQLEAGDAVYIVDLRHPLELLPDPFKLPGALHVSPEDLAARAHEIPRDRDVVLYCTCPNEASAAATALQLYKLGVERVRPLRGGFDEWKRLGYPMDVIPPANASLVQIEG